MPINRRVDYYSYISSPEWRDKANTAKQRAGYRCQVCNRSSSQVQLDAHHRTYVHLGNEAPDDITVLCRDCHKLYERSGRLPSPPTNRAEEHRPAVSKTPANRVTTNGSSNSGCYIWLVVLAIGVVFLYWQANNTSSNKAAAIQSGTDVAVYASPTQTAVPKSITLHPAKIAQNSNVRVGPGKSYDALTTLGRGTPIFVAGYSNESGWPWYCIKLGERKQMGWISSELVSGAPKTLPAISLCNESALRTSNTAIVTSAVRQGSDVSSAYPQTDEYEPSVPDSSRYDDAYQDYLDEAATMAEEDAKAAMSEYQALQEDAGQTVGCSGGCTAYPTWCAGDPVKGNVSIDTGERIYHVPGQQYYDDTKINPRYGERWFCTEEEAQAAGWRKARR